MERRAFLKAGGLALAGLAAPPWLRAVPRPPSSVTVRMWSDARGAVVGFDPVGLLVTPGTTVRWVLDGGAHSTTAYHPANGGRALRMPLAAVPWDSGVLVDPGAEFAVTLRVPGVYDYLCLPHEAAGMAGRIVVAAASAAPTTAFPDPAAHGWRPPPEAVLRTLPPVERILARRVVQAN